MRSWHRPAMLAAFGIGLFGGLHLAGWPWPGALARLDQALAEWLAAHRSDAMVRLFAAISRIGDGRQVVLWALILSVLLWRAGARRAVAALWLVPIAASQTTAWLKLLYARPRPGLSDRVLADFSFPSGHATGAVSFFGFAAWIMLRQGWIGRRAALALGGAIVLAIGLSRMVLGVHYLSDVLAGYLVGGLWALAGAWWLGPEDQAPARGQSAR